MRICHERLECEGGMLVFDKREFSMPDVHNLIGVCVSNIGSIILPEDAVDCFIKS